MTGSWAKRAAVTGKISGVYVEGDLWPRLLGQRRCERGGGLTDRVVVGTTAGRVDGATTVVVGNIGTVVRAVDGGTTDVFGGLNGGRPCPMSGTTGVAPDAVANVTTAAMLATAPNAAVTSVADLPLDFCPMPGPRSSSCFLQGTTE